MNIRIYNLFYETLFAMGAGIRKRSTLMALIIAGEAVFFLPFVLARIFRPTLLEVFEISNTELGSWFAVYGVVAMGSYFLGGPLADRFPARRLMTLALVLTASAGFLMASIPRAGTMKGIYIIWGFTTICLFWAAMIRATREWGGDNFQGRAFGWLEGGRGAVAAILGTLAFLLFREAGSDSSFGRIASTELHPFQVVILATSAGTLIAALLVWLFVPDRRTLQDQVPLRQSAKRLLWLAGKPSVWMLSGLIICAYAGYKITDDYSLYAREVLGYSEVGAAGVGTAALWLRALLALLAGWLGDRVNRMKVIIACFTLTLAAGLLVGSGLLSQLAGLLVFNLVLTAAGIYGVRALYFAIMQEANIPLAYTGTAVGMASFLGFTPEIFMSPWMGHLLDTYPGVDGHRYVFLLLSMFALLGLVIGILFMRHTRYWNGS